MTQEQDIPFHKRLAAIRDGSAPKTTGPKQRKPIAKKSAKRQAEDAAAKDVRSGEDTELVKFFKRAIKQMSGYCEETGLKTETSIYQYAIMSICHILPRSKCPSVALHPCIWVELNCDFHTKFDAMSWQEREQLGCWPIIRDKLIMVWPDLHPSEHRHFPESVLNYMEKNKSF